MSAGTPPIRWIVDLRTVMPSPGDQGGRGTCLSWASTAGHDLLKKTALSVEYLHWACGGTSTGRGSILSVREVLRVQGQPPDDQWPYDRMLPEDVASYCPPITASGPFELATIRLVTLEIDELEKELKKGGAPVLGLRITDSFLQNQGSIIHKKDPGSDGHAVSLVGIAEAMIDVGVIAAGTRMLCLRNSWGVTWGAGGFALMTEDAWKACGVAAFVLEASP